MDIFGYIIIGLMSGGILVLFSSFILTFVLTKNDEKFKKLEDKIKALEEENEVLKSDNEDLESDLIKFEKENYQLIQEINKSNFKVLNNLEASLDKLFDMDLDFDSSDKNKKGKVKK